MFIITRVHVCSTACLADDLLHLLIRESDGLRGHTDRQRPLGIWQTILRFEKLRIDTTAIVRVGNLSVTRVIISDCKFSVVLIISCRKYVVSLIFVAT